MPDVTRLAFGVIDSGPGIAATAETASWTTHGRKWSSPPALPASRRPCTPDIRTAAIVAPTPPGSPGTSASAESYASILPSWPTRAEWTHAGRSAVDEHSDRRRRGRAGARTHDRSPGQRAGQNASCSAQAIHLSTAARAAMKKQVQGKRYGGPFLMAPKRYGQKTKSLSGMSSRTPHHMHEKERNK